MSVIFGDLNEVELAYPEADDEWYTLRPLTIDLQTHWAKMTTKSKFKHGQEREERDEERYRALMWDHLIAGWRGAVYVNDEDFRAEQTSECNLANKVKFATTQADRVIWMLREAQSMGERRAEGLKAEREAFRSARAVPAAAGVRDA